MNIEEKSPSVSILIPTKNEKNNIKNCLKQIVNQSYDLSRLEVLVIDGKSEDGTRDLICEFSEQSKQLEVKIIDDLTGQRSAALNEGIRQASGDVILRVDARTILPNYYIEKCIKALFETRADNVGGIQKPMEKNVSPTQLAIGYAMAHPFGVGNAQFRLGKKSDYVDSVYLGCFRKEIFQKVGMFDEESAVITEDSDMNYRIRCYGGNVYLDKDIEAFYYPRERLKDLSKLYFRYGGARAGFMLKWKTYTSYRQLVPPLFLALLLLLPFASLLLPAFFYFWVFLVTSYVCANIFVSYNISRKKKKWRLLPVLFLIFPTMHFSWASGFWRRIFQGKSNKYWGY